MAKNESNNKKNKDNNIKYMNKRLIVTLLLLIVVFVSSTFAWFTYSSKKSALVLTIGDYNKSKMTLSPYQITGTLDPSDSYIGGVYTDVTVVNNNSVNDISMSLYYKINELPSELIDNGLSYDVERYWPEDVEAGEDAYWEEVNSGDFTGLGDSNEFVIYNEVLNANTTAIYRVYLWLDNSYDQTLVQGKTLNLELNGKIVTNPSVPVLVDGMVPVKFMPNSTGASVHNISKFSANSMDYGNGKWANAVLVTNDSREEYLSLTSSKVMPSDDILAYYVWIPRFKYKIWTTGRSSVGKEQKINIVFEDENATMSLGTSVGSYRTHPAFWWDNNEDGVVDSGEMLPGIWVSKFEISTSYGDYCYPAECSDPDEYAAASVPNVTPISGIDVEGAQYISQKIGEVSWYYGISNLDADSHLIKNSEWSAVAYLSHSDYGINKQIRINNYLSGGNTLTGCGALTADEAESSTCGISYGVGTEYPQSTTGTIEGIFDMSGGLYEYVAAEVYNDSYGGKYFDYFGSYDTDDENSYISQLCSAGKCFGHALYETYNWYRDSSVENFDDGEYIIRGGDSSSGNWAGIFSWDDEDSYGGDNIGFRNVIVPVTSGTYMIEYDVNSGTGSMDSTSCMIGSDCTLSANSFTRTGYTFNGWNTEADGSGTSYTNSQVVNNLTSVNNGTVTLYAQWIDNIPPSISASCAKSGGMVNKYSCTITYSDDGSGIDAATLSYKKNSNSYTAFGISNTSKYTDYWKVESHGQSTFTAYYKVCDYAGNCSETDGNSITLRWCPSGYTYGTDSTYGLTTAGCYYQIAPQDGETCRSNENQLEISYSENSAICVLEGYYGH